MDARVNWLVRLYPPSWRKRYGGELEVLIQEMPGHVATALDLLIGAAIAYRDVIRGNRVLSAAGAYLHGLCVAVLLEAIVFVSLIMAAQGGADPTIFRIGPVALATFVPAVRYARLSENLLPTFRAAPSAETWGLEVILLVALCLTLAALLAAPRLVRALR